MVRPVVKRAEARRRCLIPTPADETICDSRVHLLAAPARSLWGLAMASRISGCGSRHIETGDGAAGPALDAPGILRQALRSSRLAQRRSHPASWHPASCQGDGSFGGKAVRFPAFWSERRLAIGLAALPPNLCGGSKLQEAE
jgi:hypothetical protein